MSDDNKMSARWAFNVSSWIPTRRQMKLALSCVQQEEKDRIGKFVFGDSFKSSLVGRLMLRSFVQQSTGLEYDRIRFMRDEKGRPYLEDKNYDLDVNVSHQGDFAVLAGETGGACRLGVDVMKMEYTTKNRSLPDFFRLMNRHFTRSEWENIRCYTDQQQQTEAFYRHWCLKESYVKNLGCGITVNLQTISFDVKSKLEENKVLFDTVCRLDGRLLDGWRFEESLLDSAHCVAVSLYCRDKDIKPDVKSFEFVNFDDLMKNACPLLEEDEALCDEFFRKEAHPNVNN